MVKKSASKEDILNRMYAHAVRFWNVSSVESLDPGIQYLIQGLSSELFQLSNELENIKVRILQNLSSLLTPDNFTSPRCSHAIMQAKPTESPLFIDPQTSFFLEKLPMELVKKGIKKLDFTPVSTVRLFDGNIKYLICERMVYQNNKGTDKTQLAFTNVLTEKYNSSVWIGLELPKEIDSLEHVPFYIDFPQNANREIYYSLLPFTKWEVEGQPLKVKSGLPVLEEEINTYESLFLKYDLLNMTNKNILDYYKKRFLTITNNVSVSSIKKKKFPDDLKDLYEDEVYESFEPCIWLKVKFPPNIPASDLYNINICLNVFPVANRTLHSDIQKHNGITDIIPLRTENNESFLSVAEVTDSNGNKYQYIPYKSDRSCVGSFNVKQGGIERLDARGTRNTLEYLTDLLRNETSMFSGMGIEYLQNTIETMQKGLVAMEAKIDNLPETQEKNYLLVNPLEKEDNIFYSYWTTNCETANGLSVGRTLSPYNTTLIEKGSCVFISNTTGGKSAPDIMSRMDAFKYSLTTHDKISSFDDMCNFCRFELNGKIQDVEARRGVMISPKPKEGLIRCLEILITPLPQYRDIIENMKEEIKLLLEQRSPATFTYQIIII